MNAVAIALLIEIAIAFIPGTKVINGNFYGYLNE